MKFPGDSTLKNMIQVNIENFLQKKLLNFQS